MDEKRVQADIATHIDWVLEHEEFDLKLDEKLKDEIKTKVQKTEHKTPVKPEPAKKDKAAANDHGTTSITSTTTAAPKHLAALNAEAAKRDAKWKPAKTADNLGKMKEATFLEITESVGMIGKNVKQELEACLKLRNACGHPNSLKIGPNKVAAHLETLALNVYALFG